MKNQFSPRALPMQAQRRIGHQQLDFKAIASKALAAAPYLMERLLPDGRTEGREYVARNPLRSDNEAGSFKINLDTGYWADFATDKKGRDLISLTAYLRGVNQGKAAWELTKLLEGVPFMGGDYHGR